MKTIGTDPRFFWPTCIQESKVLLEACGIPVIMAPEEAEAQCVALQKRGLVEYVVTQDLDVLVYNATKVIRQLTFKTQKLRAGKWQAVQPGLTMIDGRKLCETLHLTPFELIDLSILLGNDYFPGIVQIGPQTALKAMHYYHSLEKIQQTHPSFFAQLSATKLATIRRLFMCPTVHEYTTLPAVSENFGPLRQLLLQDHSLHEDKVTPILQRIQSLSRLPMKSSDNEDEDAEASTLFDPNDFTPASHLSPNKDADKKERIERGKLGASKYRILPQVLNLDELRTKGIVGYMRFEILFDKTELEVHYVKQGDPIESWPYHVQLQFVILVDILHNLHFIPDHIYHAKYEPILARVQNADQMLEELKFLCDNACCNS
jgi:5'-3' exonuclease